MNNMCMFILSMVMMALFNNFYSDTVGNKKSKVGFGGYIFVVVFIFLMTIA